MKKILSVFLAMVMVFAIVPVSVSAYTSGYYTYTVSNGEATITDVSTSISGKVTIPDTLGGCPVTSIGSNAFEDCDNLTSVTIPNSVTSIGVGAFSGCTSLTNISVSENNTAYKSIDGVLFTKDGKTLVQYPIGKADTKYILPDSVTTIGYRAFSDCTKLTSVTIPDSVTNIGYGAFCYCDSLTSITVSENNTAYKSIDGVLFTKDGSGLIQYPIGRTNTSYTIPDTVISIAGFAFNSCTNLTSVTIPTSVTNIVKKSNNGLLDSLLGFIFGDRLDESSFGNCPNLTITCYKNSYAHTYAKDNDIPYVILCSHTSDKLVGAKSPTCIGEGYTGDIVCADCDELIEKGSTIPAAGHTIIPVAYRAPTCTEAGNEAYEYCTACSYTTYVKIPAAGHDTVQHDGVAPTCTESGYADYETCTKCSYTSYKYLPANGHSIVKHSAKSATCTEIGWFAYETCEHCDYTTYVEIRPQGHYFEGSTCKFCGEAKPVLPGDVNGNGAIDITDLSAFRRFIGGATIDGFIEAAADVDGDGEVKITDVSVLARIITGAVI